MYNNNNGYLFMLSQNGCTNSSANKHCGKYPHDNCPKESFADPGCNGKHMDARFQHQRKDSMDEVWCIVCTGFEPLIPGPKLCCECGVQPTRVRGVQFHVAWSGDFQNNAYGQNTTEHFRRKVVFVRDLLVECQIVVWCGHRVGYVASTEFARVIARVRIVCKKCCTSRTKVTCSWWCDAWSWRFGDGLCSCFSWLVGVQYLTLVFQIVWAFTGVFAFRLATWLVWPQSIPPGSRRASVQCPWPTHGTEIEMLNAD